MLWNVESMRQRPQCVQIDTGQTVRRVCTLENRIEDAENRSTRSNLIFYAIYDIYFNESFVCSEETIILHCSEYLNFSVNLMKSSLRIALNATFPAETVPLSLNARILKQKT